MKYGKVNGVIKPVSRIITGTGQFQKGEDPASLFEVFDRAYELGINTIDTGREYADGEVEMYIGRWLKQKKNRDNVVIISKGGHHSNIRKRVTPFDVTADIYDSLELLQTDYIDIYLLHRDDETKPVGPLVEMLNSHYEEGRIKTFGVSNWRMERIIEANEYAKSHGLRPLTCSSEHFSLGEQYEDPWGGGCVSLTGETQKANKQWHIDNNFAVFCYSTLSLGLFSGRFNRSNYKQKYADGAIPVECYKAYCGDDNFTRLERAEELAKNKGVSLSEIAIGFVLNYANVYGMDTYALVGAVTGNEVEINAKACDIVLTKEEMEWLDLKR